MLPPLTHVFISYCRANAIERDIVVSRLQSAKIPYLFDESIEAGGKWKPQIDEALKDSFAVVVVVTPEAMQSLYVTYEWSWALGSSIPVFPLLMKGNYDIVHSRLIDEHVEDCRNGIPDRIIQTLKEKQDTPADIEYLNDIIHRLTSPLRIQIVVTLWVYQHLNRNETLQKLFVLLLQKMTIYAEKIAEKHLPVLIINKSHAFTSKQKQRCRMILSSTKKTSITMRMILIIADGNPESFETHWKKEGMDWLDSFYKTEWLSVVQSIDERKHSSIDALDEYLGVKGEEVEGPELQNMKKLHYEYYKDRMNYDEFEKMLAEEMKDTWEMFSHGLIVEPYGEELGDLVWEAIELIHLDAGND